MKSMHNHLNEENKSARRDRISEHELDDLKEHIDQISFNLGKVYQHAKDRSRKHSLRNSMKKKIQHFYKNDNLYF